jgi:endogenous inhibitor of DNA gyrase (YacG/DUF329 family)
MALPICPTCGNEFDSTSTPAMPFCSERCRRIDLGRWLNEEISIPVSDDEEPEREAMSSDADDEE